MVGLSVVLEGYKDISSNKSAHNHQVISKASMTIKPSSPPLTRRSCNSFKVSSTTTSTGGFLDFCFLCKQKLLPGKDLYMYKGDRAFCSEECRCRQILMDEEEIMKPKTDHYLVDASSFSLLFS